MKLLVVSLLIVTMVVLTKASLDLEASPEVEQAEEEDTSSESVPSDNPNIVKRSTCGEFWKQLGNRCFIYVKQRVPWFKAKKMCESKGGNLTTIQNKEEESFVTEMIGWGRPWIGLSFDKKEGQWVSADGEPIEYTNWCRKNLVNNRYHQRNCAMMMNLISRTCSNDDVCSRQRSFLCSKTVG